MATERLRIPNDRSRSCAKEMQSPHSEPRAPQSQGEGTAGIITHGYLIVLLMVSVVQPVWAAESPLAAIPAQAGLVVRFKSPSATIDKVADFATELQPDAFKADGNWGDLIRTLKDTLHQSCGSDSDLERDWWLFCLDPLDDGPNFAVAVPAIDFESVMAVVEKPDGATKMESVVYKSWVIYGSLVEIDAVRQCMSGDGFSIESRFNTQGLAVFNQGDVGAFVNVHRLKEANADGIGKLQEPLQSMLAVWMPDEFRKSHAGGVLQQVSSQFGDALFQGITDTEFAVISIALDDDDLQIENYVGIKSDTPTAAFLQANPGSKMDAMSGLPASSAVYLGFQGNQKALTTWMSQLMKSFASNGETGLTPAHEEIRRGYEQLNYGMFAMALPMRPVEQGVLRWLTVSEVDDPVRARELATKWNALPDCMPNASGEQKTAPVRSIETYGEFTADVVKSEDAIFVKVGDEDLDKKILNILSGPDGNTTRTVYLKDRIVECFGGTKVRTAAAIRRAAEYSRGRIVAEPHFAKTQEQLGTNANLIVMVDMSVIAAVSMQLWNTYMDIALQEMMDEDVQPAGFQKLGIDLDEGVPDEAVPNKTNADDVEHGKKEQAGDPDPKMPKEVEVANPVAEQVMDAQLAEISSMKIAREVIDSIETSRSLVGLSLLFEPEGTRVKIAIPRFAIKQVVNVGELMLKRSGIIEPDIQGIEVEDAE